LVANPSRQHSKIARQILVEEFGPDDAYLKSATHRLCRKFREDSTRLLEAACERAKEKPAGDNNLLDKVLARPRKNKPSQQELVDHAKGVARLIKEITSSLENNALLMSTFQMECFRLGVKVDLLPESVAQALYAHLLLGPTSDQKPDQEEVSDQKRLISDQDPRDS